ncbi:hypothetical protein DYQ86_13390 [Acidobacteria bacterium AB60]|nr:hypothetical protein DYQ86_13390 [Acidobacteria bacterium AB60]
MTQPMDENEVKAQLNLIESMIAQGRRTTERWSWAFVLWGVAYIIALAWSTWGPFPAFAWPATMLAAGFASWIIGSRVESEKAETTLGRAMGSLWLATAITMFVLFPALGFSGHMLEVHVFIAVACAILGLANGASAMMLRWKTQLACAIAWWAASALSSVVTGNVAVVIFLAAIFLCNIVFGIYAMTRESRGQRAKGAVHA